MDDANAPNLVSVAYFGDCAADDPDDLRTLALILSAGNPWFHSLSAGEGIGSPHTPRPSPGRGSPGPTVCSANWC